MFPFGRGHYSDDSYNMSAVVRALKHYIGNLSRNLSRNFVATQVARCNIPHNHQLLSVTAPLRPYVICPYGNQAYNAHFEFHGCMHRIVSLNRHCCTFI